jgi:hypothetical protein
VRQPANRKSIHRAASRVRARLRHAAAGPLKIDGGSALLLPQEGRRFAAIAPHIITSSLMDYALPRAADLPAFEIHLVECPTRSNPLGCKGAGQAGAIGAPQTIINAIIDALKPYGIEHIDMPATPLSILTAIRNRRIV